MARMRLCNAMGLSPRFSLLRMGNLIDHVIDLIDQAVAA
jgi:hypothetical protein